MDDADPAFTSHGDSGFGFRHRIHRGTEQRDVDGDITTNPGLEIYLRRQMFAVSWNQQYVVESEALAELRVKHGREYSSEAFRRVKIPCLKRWPKLWPIFPRSLAVLSWLTAFEAS